MTLVCSSFRVVSVSERGKALAEGAFGQGRQRQAGDAALYSAKQKGLNRVDFAEE